MRASHPAEKQRRPDAALYEVPPDNTKRGQHHRSDDTVLKLFKRMLQTERQYEIRAF